MNHTDPRNGYYGSTVCSRMRACAPALPGSWDEGGKGGQNAILATREEPEDEPKPYLETRASPTRYLPQVPSHAKVKSRYSINLSYPISAARGSPRVLCHGSQSESGDQQWQAQ